MLDDIGRAREHGELVGGFKSVAESLETVAAKMGLQQFGKEGEPFDPTIHEALMHSYAPDVTETTCVADPPAGVPHRRAHHPPRAGGGRRAPAGRADRQGRTRPTGTSDERRRRTTRRAVARTRAERS